MANIQTLFDPEVDIIPEMDGGVYGTGISDCVCKGIGDEFAYIKETGSSTITFKAGSQAIIGGSFFRLTGDCVVDFTGLDTGTYKLCACINKGLRHNGSTDTGSFTIKQANVEPTIGNLNGSDTIREMLLYTVDVTNGVPTKLTDKRTIKGNGQASFGGVELVYLTKTQYEALATKEANTYYFIKES